MKVQNPVIGRASGKVSNLVFATQFGKNTVRSMPVKSSRPPSDAQLAQRQKVAVFIGTARDILSYVRTGYKMEANGMSAFNAFTKDNIHNVIIGAYPNQTIDIEALKLAKGTLTGSAGMVVTRPTTLSVEFNWDDNSGQGDASATDCLMRAIYNPTKKGFVSTVKGKVKTSVSDTVALPASWANDDVYVWTGWVSSDNTRVSDSEFQGVLEKV